MLPTLDLGPISLPTAGLVYLLGVWLALSVVERAAARLGGNVPATYTMAAGGLAAAVIAARVVFVVQRWEAYRQNLLGIVWPLTSGYNLVAGLVVGVAAAFFYARARRLAAWPTLDALAPGLLVILIAVSLADFLAGPGFGVRSDVFWSIDLFGVRRHPVQLYEIAAGLLALIAWQRSTRAGAPPGQPFLVAGALYGAGRLLADAFRANAPLTANGFHVVQLISFGLLLACVWLLSRRAPAGHRGVAGTSE
jgi:phosphatidylglycerol---prolipoprotein diacylglyceryl transferase